MRIPSVVAVAVVAVLTSPGCPGGSDVDGAGEGEGEGEGEGGAEGEGEGEGEGEARVFSCDLGDEQITAAAGCSVDADCALTSVFLDCCGTRLVTGISGSVLVTFESAYAECAASQPLCDCIPSATTANDGSVEQPAGALALCIDGLCSSTFAAGGARTFACADETLQLVTDSGCSADADCAVGTFQIDCCGSLRATGIRADTQVTFADDAQQCASTFGDCKCAASPTVADDGSVFAGADAAVACVAGLCATAF